jgi:hypothetical protein
MSKQKQYNLSTSEGFMTAFGQFTYLKEKGAIIEIKEVKQTRTNRQNSALHLYFTNCANALNDAGEYFQYLDYKNVSAEMLWSGEMFKNYWIKPIIKVLYDVDSTTKLKTNEIDQIIDVISKRFAEIGIAVNFPNQFDFWLKKVYG